MQQRDYPLRGCGNFPSLEALRERILAFIDYWNQTAKPFQWTYKGCPLVI